ncbi:hypothetical protein Naga_100658g3 [Nannochloropsis gaditana]|uniref:Uncharacterized protein n=1 Tax=Nannochloropsis gaditana TaxID=72520 RepID=W7T9P4_9STRA|nr:hypothetical protein Naga_100658g3 [Nannochloropsis gaditana]
MPVTSSAEDGGNNAISQRVPFRTSEDAQVESIKGEGEGGGGGGGMGQREKFAGGANEGKTPKETGEGASKLDGHLTLASSLVPAKEPATLVDSAINNTFVTGARRGSDTGSGKRGGEWPANLEDKDTGKWQVLLEEDGKEQGHEGEEERATRALPVPSTNISIREGDETEERDIDGGDRGGEDGARIGGGKNE